MPMLPSARSTITSVKPLAVAPLEAGRLLSVSQTRIYVMMRAGELDDFWCGRARRITLKSIEKYLALQLAAANKAAGRPASLRRELKQQRAARPKTAAPPKRRAKTHVKQLPAE
jgi:hypothetical protein